MRANFVLSGVATGIRRNMTMTIALILNTAIALAFVGGSILADREITKFKHDYEGKLNVSVFMCTKPIKLAGTKPNPSCPTRYTDAQKTAIQAKLRADPMVTSSDFVSEQEQVARFRATSTPLVARTIHVGDLPASFTVHLKNLNNDYEAFRTKYAAVPGVGGVENQVKAFKTLLTLIARLRLGSIVLAIVVLVASVLLIANAIQVAAAQRRNETSIMRLVGASRWMTELPFMLETILATFVGGLIALGLITIGKQYMLNNVFRVPVENGVIPNLDTNDILVAGGFGLIAGIVLAALTAFATLRLYVKL
jgi:cell division transport system permease protein